MTVSTTAGPGWSLRGLDHRPGTHPLRVEAHVAGWADRLLPGVPPAGCHPRHLALYAALAAYAGERGLDAAACRRLVRRGEAILAAVAVLEERAGGGPAAAHGAERVTALLRDGLDVAAAAGETADARSPEGRSWGYWTRYAGPCTALGTVTVTGLALRPGRHPCPASVRAPFAPLFAAAERDRLPERDLRRLRHLAPQAGEPPEGPWLRGLVTATTGDGTHDPRSWRPGDRRRRSALRMVGRATLLHGDRAGAGWTETVRSAVAFGPHATADPVLAGLPEVASWRGLLLRQYSALAWRRLWSGLVRSMGSGGSADSGRDELRAWLADAMDGGTLRAFERGLPATVRGGHPAAAERDVLRDAVPADRRTGVALLLLGARRAGELTGPAHTAFTGPPEPLNPEWVARRAGEFRDRSLRDFAARLVDDMLAQSQRVALATMRAAGPDGRFQVYAQVHERGGRFYRAARADAPDDAGDAILRIGPLADLALRLGLLARHPDGAATVTATGRALLEPGS